MMQGDSVPPNKSGGVLLVDRREMNDYAADKGRDDMHRQTIGK